LGCLKLAYYQTEPTLKVAYRNGIASKKGVQGWLSVDPLAEKYPNMSPYCYVANNPIKYIDPDGREIVVPNVADRAPILKMINARAVGTFAFDKNGVLYQASAKGDATKFSQYYSDKLVAAINDKSHKIEVLIGNDIKGATLNSDGKTMTKDAGSAQNVDKESGGGVTFCGPAEGTDQVVYISGNENKTLKDTDGKALRDKPADILAHELVGHAIPWTVGSDTGNAVENENKVRKEFKENGQKGKSPLRAPEPGHTE
jgi:RHS repeat-associated protein